MPPKRALGGPAALLRCGSAPIILGLMGAPYLTDAARWWGGLGVAMLLGAGVAAQVRARPTAPARAVLPGPSKGRPAVDRVAANEGCQQCHRQQAADWSRSLHRHAFDNPVFAASFGRNREPFCRSCHAPESDPRTPVSGAESSVGVGCVTCHGMGDDVLAVPRATMSSVGIAPHGVVRDARFAASGACAGCHEFQFPDRKARVGPEWMQKTVTEHAASDFAGRSCADCHMPPGSNGSRSHDFSVVSRPDMIRDAIIAKASRPEPGLVRIELSSQFVGHAVPTGDLFRRLVVRARRHAHQGWGDIAYARRHFGRARPRGTSTIVERSDTRILPGPGSRVFELRLPEASANEPLHWQVVYERVTHAQVGRPAGAEVASQIVLHQGTLETNR